uniref:Multiple epidermal growth factor-like domains protein 10 n=1 Tax=Crassostrea virginica TaxID=6565 RepID=A0A8B8CPW9_CRAVI|nr:multiple epidermal growth factor-like domains protein 10 [Crassostrea virginica]
MKVTVIVFFVQFTYMTFGTNSLQTNVCTDRGRETCCSGYYELNGTCLECFGAFGVNCSLPCADASYGYQCKNKCTCAYNEVCDKYRGCVRLDCFGERKNCSCKENEVCNKYFGCIPFGERVVGGISIIK